MKKIIVFCLLLLWYVQVAAQVDGSLLLGLNEFTTAEMNLIMNPISGSLIYNTTEDSTFQYTGTEWVKLAPSLAKVAEKLTNYTAVATDTGTVLTFNSATDVTFTLNPGLPVGFNISLYQIGDGKVTIASGAGVTLKNRLSRFITAGKDAGAGIICTANNTFHVTGDLIK